DQFLGLGERAVDDGSPGSRELHPCPFRARLQAFAGLHDAGVHQLLVELAHVSQQLMVRENAGLRVLGCLDDDHESHLDASLVVCSYGCEKESIGAYAESSRTGRTSTLPTRAGGIFAAHWIASFKSVA